MFTVQEISERYCVSQNTVLDWLHRGDLVGVNVGRAIGKKKPRWRIAQAALEAFEAARTPAPPPARARRRKRQNDTIQFFQE